MATKKFMSLERLQEYDVLIKQEITNSINNSLGNIANGTTVVKEAEHATSADTATNANSAVEATKAVQDASGNTITSTYETKIDAQTKYDTIVNAKADWNQNDENAIDYIKNRTHWSEYTETIFVDNLSITTADIGMGVPMTALSVLEFSEGFEYNVVWNGTKYLATCFVLDGALCLGNASILDAGENTEEPFLIITNSGGNTTLCSSEAGTYTISIFGVIEEIHKIQTKYLELPEGANIGFYGTGDNSEIFNSINNTASGKQSHAEGHETTASGAYSHAEGRETEASGMYAHAEGLATKATNIGAHAEGASTEASGLQSHAEGCDTIASGDCSHAEGEMTKASGDNSHVEGRETEASGLYSHAEGYKTKATNIGAHAEGASTEASGLQSHAEGCDTIASGDRSHAEGYETIASGAYSHVEGRGTIAKADEQHVQGMYNIEDSNGRYSHIVGNGTTADARSNAHTLDWNGNAWFAGKVYVGGTSQDDASEVALKSDLESLNLTGYETTENAQAKLDEAKTYADNAANTVKNDLLNGAGTAYDTLKELGDLIENNADAIEALEAIASGKADATHSHAIADVSGLQSALDGKAAASHGTHVTYSTTAPVMNGTASVGTASTVARSDHKHPTDTSRAAKSDFDNHVADTTKHITSTERTNWGAAYTHSQAAHAPSNAEKNQNAFSNVKVGSTTIAADTTTDTLTFVAGENVTITPDATNDKITIAATDTVYTHPTSGVTAGTYKSVTVNAQGHVTGGSNPTTLAGYGITDAASKTHNHAISDITNLQTTLNNASSAISANTSSISGHTTRIEALETKVGDGFEEITSAEIQALFA